MHLNVVYVDDEYEARKALDDAVEKHNRSSTGAHIQLKLIKNPSELRQKLAESDELVLADVYYEDADKLSEIIDIVWRSSTESRPGLPTPIIAYTGRGEDALNECLKRRDELFDIWDKSTAGPEYVTWRLSQVAVELSRIHPDSLIQRLIRGMPRGAAWHAHVVEMATKYGAGLTEADQIYRAGTAVENIANDLGVWEKPCKPLWKLMSDWEFLSRAVTGGARGHARHVINVFWLGYYLIHQPQFKQIFGNAWKTLLDSKEHKLDAVSKVPALEALSACWYYAGIFHDVGGCGQKYKHVRKRTDELVSVFPDLQPLPNMRGAWPPKELLRAPKQLWRELGRLGALVEPLWEASIKKEAPDHGVLAALHFRRCLDDKAQRCFAREAARAMAIHNLVGEIELRNHPAVKWESEPIICLLLLCDQLETWDRERGDDTVEGPDSPGRAQLASLNVHGSKGRITLSMCIDYITPRYVERAPAIREREKLRLESTLKGYPSRALARIARPWPFNLEVDCRLNGRPLSHGIKFVD